VPQKLDDCVATVKGQKGVDNPWAICNAQLGKETKEHHNPMDIPTGPGQGIAYGGSRCEKYSITAL